MAPVGQIEFTGDYHSWEAAQSASTGYDDPEILARTRAAMVKVRDGEAAFERDSVVFHTMEYRFPLLSGLLRAAAARGGRLSVVDFGGALGSSYFQCRPFVSVLEDLRWSVVEQPAHVACGRREFSSEQLRFYGSLDECLQSESRHLLLLSALLQYLPTPYDTLRELLAREFDHVIIDRAPFLRRDRDRLTVQTVPESIYPARYSAWFFSESSFRATCSDAGYRIVADFPGSDTVAPRDDPAYFKGFILDKAAAAGGRVHG
jgi:putative methyltransferase (TIGR04325 family)